MNGRTPAILCSQKSSVLMCSVISISCTVLSLCDLIYLIIYVLFLSQPVKPFPSTVFFPIIPVAFMNSRGHQRRHSMDFLSTIDRRDTKLHQPLIAGSASRPFHLLEEWMLLNHNGFRLSRSQDDATPIWSSFILVFRIIPSLFKSHQFHEIGHKLCRGLLYAAGGACFNSW